MLDAAAANGLHCWLYLGELPDLPPRAPVPGLDARAAAVAGDGDVQATTPAWAPARASTSRATFRGQNWIRPEGSCAPPGG